MKNSYAQTGKPGPDEILFLPLGGSGEIGMNMNVYGHDGQWLIADVGVCFGNPSTPGIDIITPDPSFIEDRRHDLAGIVLTHAHEDHLGAVAYLWEGLQCPIYATPFTANILRNKLEREGLLDEVPVHEIPIDGRFKLGVFDVEFVTMTHSIAEPSSLIIRTKAGTVMHTGDWKLDKAPVIGQPIQEEKLKAIGNEGILAMICDSTNALSKGRSGSETEVGKKISEVIGRLTTGKIAVASFASNIARLVSIITAAQEHGRAVVLAGRSLWRMHEAATQTGYINESLKVLEAEEAKDLPAEKVLYICTGSQGEARAALNRIADGTYNDITLGLGDHVLFSSRKIPGNEVAINRIQNKLAKRGCHLITPAQEAIHTSGHPKIDELHDIYQWMKPRISIPVHGEYLHLKAHADIARQNGVKEIEIPKNGECYSLSVSEGVKLVDEVPSGYLGLDGDQLIPLTAPTIGHRRKLSQEGVFFASVSCEKNGTISGEPQLSGVGLSFADTDWSLLKQCVYEAVEKTKRVKRKDISDSIRMRLRRKIRDLIGKRPWIDIHVFIK